MLERLAAAIVVARGHGLDTHTHIRLVKRALGRLEISIRAHLEETKGNTNE